MVDLRNRVDILENQIKEIEAQQTALNLLKRQSSVLKKWLSFVKKVELKLESIDDYGLTRLENLIASGQDLVADATPVAEPAPVAEPTPAAEPEPVVETVAEPVVETVEEVEEEVVEEEVEYEEVEEEEVEEEEEEETSE